MLHSLQLKKIGHDVGLFYSGPILEDWEKRVSKEIQINSLPFGLPPSRKNMGEIIDLIKTMKTFDKIIVHHHIDPFTAYYLSKILSEKIIWYCGEPLRALWEDHLTGISYKDLNITVKSTSRDFYGESLTSIMLSDWLYSFSIHTLRALDISTAHSYGTIIANSNYSNNVVRKLYRLKGEVDIVYPGVEKYNLKERYNPVYSDFILAVGSFIPMKNYFNLLEAYKHFIKKTGLDIKLLIIGDGPLKSQIMNSINGSQLKNVVIRSKISEEELINYYKTCRFVAHVAINEPFGLIPIEAGIYEKPAVVSNMGGLRETVVDKASGFRVDPYSYKSIASSMAELALDEDLCRDMGQKAKSIVLDKFTIEKSTENLSKVIMSS